MKKKILILTDTMPNQINGVVRTMEMTTKVLQEKFDVETINPLLFKTIKISSYPGIEFAIDLWKISKYIKESNPDYIHIVTEGPIGLYTRLYCKFKRYNFTTSYHTQFPEFFKKMFGIPLWITYCYVRWFHNSSKCVFVPTNIIKTQLENNGFKNLRIWKRGVDSYIFNPELRNRIMDDTKIILCVSRISKEKGLDDFCSLTLPKNYVKILIGDGPYLEELKSKYSDVNFLGKKEGYELAECYSNADVFIFPSKTDTFGLTQLEAMSCGIPILSYKGTVSEEIIKNGITGYLVESFNKEEIDKALKLDKKVIAFESMNWNWEKCTRDFIKGLVEK